MRRPPIYVVMSTTGDYSATTVDPLVWFFDEKEADAYAEACTAAETKRRWGNRFSVVEVPGHTE